MSDEKVNLEDYRIPEEDVPQTSVRVTFNPREFTKEEITASTAAATATEQVAKLLQKGMEGYIGVYTEEGRIAAEKLMSERALKLLCRYSATNNTAGTERLQRAEKFIEILENCSKGCQDCSNCVDVICCDNTHPRQREVLQRAVVNQLCEIDDHKKKIARLDALLGSSMEMTKRLQKDAREYREYMQKTINDRRKEVDKLGEEWEALDASDQQMLGEKEAYLQGVQYAYDIFISGDRKNERHT